MKFLRVRFDIDEFSLRMSEFKIITLEFGGKTQKFRGILEGQIHFLMES